MTSVSHTFVILFWTTLSYTFSMLLAHSASGHHYFERNPLKSAVPPDVTSQSVNQYVHE